MKLLHKYKPKGFLSRYQRGAALLLAAALAITSCGTEAADTASDGLLPISGAEATSMHLMRSEGQVGVSDDEGKELEAMDNLGLYSGYQVATRTASYAWIDLDEVKLTKLDQDSQIEIQKEDRSLEIQVKSGNFFFYVTEPLEENEVMNIRTSTMMLGIRGTCGWVTVPDPEHMNVYILEGTVECTVTEPSGRTVTARISGGESAEMSLDSQGKGSIARGTFDEREVPAFVLEEIAEDEVLSGKIREASGLVLSERNEVTITAQDLEAIGYHGDAGACSMTEEQANAYAQVLREEIEKAEADFTPLQDGYTISSEPRCYAALVDVGGGNPLLLFGSAMAVRTTFTEEGEEYLMGLGNSSATQWGIWEYADGEALRSELAGRTTVYPDYLFVGGTYPDGSGYNAAVYPFENGRIASEPSTVAQGESVGWDEETGEQYEASIDGQTVSKEQLDAWDAQWQKEESQAGYSHGSDVSVWFWGLSSAKSVLSVLEGNGPLAEEENAGNGQTDVRTVVSYDPGTLIRHTDVDPGGYQLEAYYEIPVFAETTEGYQRINAFFQTLEDEFLDPENGEAAELIAFYREYADYNNDIYSNCWLASILDHTDKYVCVGHSGYFYMGGPHGADILNCYTFRTDTGDRLYLSDVADASPEEITAFLLSAIQEEDGGNGFIDLGTFQAYEADDYGFYIQDGRLFVTFNRYEGVPYAYGAIGDIELTMGLKEEWK